MVRRAAICVIPIILVSVSISVGAVANSGQIGNSERSFVCGFCLSLVVNRRNADADWCLGRSFVVGSARSSFSLSLTPVQNQQAKVGRVSAFLRSCKAAALAAIPCLAFPTSVSASEVQNQQRAKKKINLRGENCILWSSRSDLLWHGHWMTLACREKRLHWLQEIGMSMRRRCCDLGSADSSELLLLACILPLVSRKDA